MRVIFVYLDLAADEPTYSGYFYQGIAYLSAVLKKAGFEARLVQLTKEISFNEFQSKIKLLNPDLISFSSTSHMFPQVQKYAAAVKEVSKIPIICGGIHPTICPEQVINDKNIDMICRGESEQALLELCQRMERGKSINNIDNIWVKEGKKIYKNKIRPVIPDLDALPFPDREIFDYANLNLEKKGVATFMFSRGCPFNCAFCCESTLRKLYPNPECYVRFRSPGSAVKEIKETIKKYPFIKFIRLDDDLLFIKKEWVREFVVLYKKEVGLPFSADMRVDVTDDELLALIREARGHLLRFGVESGNNFILKNVLQKGITVEQIKTAFKIAKEKGFKTQSYNMVGLPYESPKEILDTIKLNTQIKPDISVVSIFYPYPGTQLYDFCLKNGFLKENIEVPKNYYSYSVLTLPTIRKEQISFFFRYFHVLKTFYGLLFRIPFSNHLIFFNDKLFSFKYMPELARFTADPLRLFRRKILRLFNKRSKTDTEAI